MTGALKYQDCFFLFSDVYFWTGEGTPNASDYRVADKNGNR